MLLFDDEGWLFFPLFNPCAATLVLPAKWSVLSPRACSQSIFCCGGGMNDERTSTGVRREETVREHRKRRERE